MSSRGWEQFGASLVPTSVFERDLTVDYDPIFVSPLEIGPATRDEAYRYGMLGVAWAFQSTGGLRVESNSTEYDSALEGCRARKSTSDAIEIVSDVVDLTNTVFSHYRELAWPELEPIVIDELTCMDTAGWAIGDPENWLGDESLAALLSGIGVEPGSAGEASSAPLVDDVAEGDVAVLPSVAGVTYTASPSELDFALDWVACAETIGFVDDFERVQIPIRRAVENEYSTDIAALMVRIEQARIA